MAGSSDIKVHVPEGHRVRYGGRLVRGPETLSMSAADAAPLLASGTVLDEEAHRELKRLRSDEKRAESEARQAKANSEAYRQKLRSESAKRNAAFNAERAEQVARRKGRLEAAVEDVVEVELLDEPEEGTETGVEVELQSFKTKQELVDYAKKEFGADLNVNENRERLEAQLEALANPKS